MTTFQQDQLSAFARSIVARLDQAGTASPAAPLPEPGTDRPGDRVTALERQLANIVARHAAERNAYTAVVERLDRDVAVLRGEVAALTNERAEHLAALDRLQQETRTLIERMMGEVVGIVEDRARAPGR